MKGAVLAVAALAAILAAPAQAADVRVGKGNPTAFTFTPVDIGKEYGIFQKHGLNVEITSFAGATRIHQGMAADQIDIGLASGPDMVFVAKGSPVKAVANMAGPPLLIGLGVRPDGSVTNVAQMKDRTVGVTTLGSLTWWLPREVARLQGWGTEGIETVQVNSTPGMIAALKTKQVDGVTTDSVTVYNIVEEGSGRILVKFGDSVKDFHVHVIYASDKLIQSNPDGLKAFLAGWMETIRFMRDNKAKAIDMAAQKTGVSKAVAAEGYNDTMPILSTTGHFEAKALDVLATSFVDTKLLPDKPDMSKLLTEAYLPK